MRAGSLAGAFAVALGVFATGGACSSFEGEATGVDFRGTPLAVFNGTMTADRMLPLQHSVRLGVLWTAEIAERGERVPQLVAEAHGYEPVFPAAFSIPVYDVPTGTALTDLEPLGGRGKFAMGFIVAFEDRNENGLLDLYAAGEPPVDRVLALSLGSARGDPTGSAGYGIIYLDGEPAPDLPSGLEQGFNLFNLSSERVPLQTPIPLHLSSNERLDLFACRSFLDDAASCLGLSDPDGGAQPPGTLSISGSLGRTGRDATEYTYTNVFLDGLAREDAILMMNQTVVPWSAKDSAYVVRLSDAGTLTMGNSSEVTVGAPGADPLTMTVPLVGNFEILEPTEFARLPRGAGFDIRWTLAEGAVEYELEIRTTSAANTVLLKTRTPATTWTVAPIDYPGAVSIFVTAYPAQYPFEGPNGSVLYVSTNVSRSITLVAP